jgi:hypothetical protein
MIEYTVRVYDGGTAWYVNGNLHREGDLPALEYTSGDKAWYKNGLRHREGLPAMVFVNGQKEWYKDGKLHREDGPAVEYVSGAKSWYVNGKLHRTDGPAVEYANGQTAWYVNGKRLYEQAVDVSRDELDDLNAVNAFFNATKARLLREMVSYGGRVVEIDGVKYELKEIA